jgi:hypothetical protein
MAIFSWVKESIAASKVARFGGHFGLLCKGIFVWVVITDLKIMADYHEEPIGQI